jgi:signal transduction histidine kinase
VRSSPPEPGSVPDVFTLQYLSYGVHSGPPAKERRPTAGSADGARRRRWQFWAVALGGTAACAVAAIVTASGSGSDYVALEATARALIVGVPIAVGLYARSHPASERFGTLLIAAGFGWFLVTLAGSSDARLYSTGRVADWLVEVLLVYVVLAFPSGRLPSRADRLLVAGVALVSAFLYVPTALLVEQFPVPAPSVTCVASCPENAFMLVATEPAWVEDFVRPLRELLTVGLFLGVTVRLAQRFRGATHLTQRTLAPVLGVACFRLAALALTISVRRIDPAAPLMDVAIWLIALAVPLMACAFLLGTWRWQLFMATAMHRLTTRLQAHPGPEDLRAALADAFDDPELEIVYWLDEDGGRWTDAAGLPVAPPSAAAERCVTEVRDGGRRVAAIVHDAALRDDQAFVDAASAYAIMALDNHRLSAQTAALLREVQESRARIQSSADDERRRIEHDLHDGAQQRLVALRIKLELAAESAAGGNGHSAELLRGLGVEVDEALDEVRSLARGIYPAPLADRGLTEALRAVALRGALPTTVLAAGVRRYSRQVESAAYFCCLEAMQNAAKHARDASAVVVALSDNGSLRFEVRDDGAGFDEQLVTSGMGFTSMRDRVEAVGGELEVRSRPGHGTTVSASIPLDREPATA